MCFFVVFHGFTNNISKFYLSHFGHSLSVTVVYLERNNKDLFQTTTFMTAAHMSVQSNHFLLKAKHEFYIACSTTSIEELERTKTTCNKFETGYSKITGS